MIAASCLNGCSKAAPAEQQNASVFQQTTISNYNIIRPPDYSEFYLNCVPFGFRMNYSIHKYNRGHQYDVSIEKCETIF